MSYTKNGMMMYRGKYRVVCEFDRSKLIACPEDNYIYCAKGGQIYRYNDDLLVFYRDGCTVSNIISQFKAANIQIHNDGSTGSEALIRFNECDLDRVADIVSPRTLGANINPKSKRNLKLFKWYRDMKN